MSAPTSPTAAELFSLQGRTALVTGASAGLGARFAAVLAQAGATVFAAARRIDRLKELADSDARIHPVACDVSLAADRTRLAETALAATGRLDILVNNAATSGETRAEDESPDAFADVLGVNLTAPYHLARLTAEAPGDTGGRSIINVSSILGLVTAAPLGGASYSASKAGLIGLTRELAGQWGRQRHTCQRARPGLVPHRDDRRSLRRRALQPLGRAQHPAGARRRRP